MSGRVVHPPRHVPAPAITVNLHRAAGNWAANRARAKTLVDWEGWRERAQAIKADAIRHLPELLETFAAAVTQAGGHVHHARTATDAVEAVAGVCAAHGARVAVKGKSMLSEELGLNAALAARGIEPVETDLGEYIVQAMGDRPSHVLAPAVHLSAAQVAELFGAMTGRVFDPADTETLVGHARAALRERFLAADVGITGVNFGIAETGTLVLVESEGNIRLTSGLPRVHVAVMGIEKLVRSVEGVSLLVQMLPLAAHGRPTATYTSYVTGPARGGDDGPCELHVVLVDDGRSALRGTPFESALHCIRCGACLYACPVYRQVGGHAYGTAYSGPIGAVITPLLEDGAGGTDDLAWMSSLCGACTEACPVRIPLDEQLVALRARARDRDPHRAEAALFEAWSRLWSSPSGYRATAVTAGRALAPLWAASAGGGDADGWVARAPFPFSGWTSVRDAPEPARESFHARWRRTRGGRGAPTSAAPARAPQPAAGERAPGPAGRVPVETVPGPVAPAPAEPDLLAAFAARLTELDGQLHRAASLAEARAVARGLVGDATVARWSDRVLEGIAARTAPDAAAEVSLIVADCAVADTGAIAFAHGAGRSRAAALLPERQIALLSRDAILRTVADALAAVLPGAGSVVFAGGPSRTADIEQRMIRGMHAPRTLDVVVYEP